MMITFKLAQAVSDENGHRHWGRFNSFWEWWVVKTTKDKYGGLMEAGGDNFKEFY
jgi:hypothetical protein